MATVDRCCCVSLDRRLIFCLVFGSTMASCNDSWNVDSPGGNLWLLDWDRIVVGIGSMSVRHNWLVCKLHTAPTVDKKALLSSREEFQFNLMSNTWKSTGTRVLPIFTSRSLTIPPQFLWEQTTKVNNSCEGSTCRPRWSAITLGSMLIDAPVLHNACGNSIPFTVHGITNYPGSLFFFSVTLFLIFSLASQNILLVSSSFSLVSLKNIHNLWV
ncbi:hypothetical protein F2Q69_00023215 [Brassica cretica]|uniref:Uncharacterized protein n=1 Tax=Brassica cretica TaxID=69181 RepID=A0A8S9QGC9_BRACR|nr:hypothetical protein F2Q69_00023215 [Brassica cretica]